MEWIPILVVAGFVAAFLGLKHLGSVSPDAAREHLRQGAKIIDVRGREEYQARHLPQAINIPLGELAQRIAQHAPNKDDVLLLHCLSGGRSGMGCRVLKGMGYTKVFNLGSIGRAERIASEGAK
jgi:phage shock protein E